MAPPRRQRRTERSKLDATPPWDTSRGRDTAPTTGPYDAEDVADDGVERLDLGALRVPVESGFEVRLEVNDQNQVMSVNLVNRSGQLQLGVFAAPRSEGIWAEIRKEIKASISSQGGTVQDHAGEFGTELTGKLPAPGGFTQVRFIGVDGPRWFLRGMLAGPAASDSVEAVPFLDAFRSLVVVRGNEPLPVRDPVPLVLPPETAAQLAANAEQSDQD
jgi:Protein of unknown function (DUF3710)